MLLFCLPVSGQDKVSYLVHLTSKFKDGQPDAEPMTRFDCSDRIYLLVTAVGLSKGKHELKALWIDPFGKQKEVTRYQFDGLPVTQVWAWLQLHGPTGTIIGQMFDPSFGMEEFIGEWKIEAFIDNEPISEKNFRFSASTLPGLNCWV